VSPHFSLVWNHEFSLVWNHDFSLDLEGSGIAWLEGQERKEEGREEEEEVIIARASRGLRLEAR